MSKITIEDISRHTGLSRGTVSRALNDRPDISHQTKQKVLEACKQLNYVPSHAARSLATGRSYAVAVLVDDLRSAFAACFLRGVVERAQADRYAVYVAELSSGEGSVSDHLNALSRGPVDGVLLAASLGEEAARPVREVMETRPVVATAELPGVSCDILAPDHTEAGRLVGRRMLGDGRTNVLFVHDPGVVGAAQRLDGFHETCRQHQLDPAPLTLQLPPSETDVSRRFEAVRARLEGVKVVGASDDFAAFQIMLMLCEGGRVPGRDVGVIGQGNEPFGARLSPGLTTVDFGGEEIGRRAMEVALQRATKARQDAPQTTHVAPVLVERGSTELLG